jgi:hypothetical protein
VVSVTGKVELTRARGEQVKFWSDKKKSESGSATIVVPFAEGTYSGLGGAKNRAAFEEDARRFVEQADERRLARRDARSDGEEST